MAFDNALTQLLVQPPGWSDFALKCDPIGDPTAVLVLDNGATGLSPLVVKVGGVVQLEFTNGLNFGIYGADPAYQVQLGTGQIYVQDPAGHNGYFYADNATGTFLYINDKQILTARQIIANLSKSAAATVYDADTHDLIEALKSVILNHGLGAAA